MSRDHRSVILATVILAVALVVLPLPAFSQAGSFPGSACEVPPDLATSRPGLGAGPTQVQVGIVLIDLQKVVDAEQTFVVDFALFLHWTDPRLAAFDGCRLDAGDLWHPVPIFPSQRDLELKLENFRLLPGGAGRMSLARRYYGQFSSPLDLRDFPFDEQELSIDMIPAGHSPEDIEWVFDGETSGRSEVFSIPDWEVSQASHAMGTVQLSPSRVFPVFSYRIPVQRHAEFYLTKVILPLAFIVLMSYLVFFIDPELLPPQVGLSTASVLTLIAFQFSLGYYLPRVAYLTRLDKFLLGSTVMVFTALTLAVLTGSLARKDKKIAAQTLERSMRWIFPLAFLAVTAVAFWL